MDYAVSVPLRNRQYNDDIWYLFVYLEKSAVKLYIIVLKFIVQSTSTNNVN